jgi:hypothetical protein
MSQEEEEPENAWSNQTNSSKRKSIGHTESKRSSSLQSPDYEWWEKMANSEDQGPSNPPKSFEEESIKQDLKPPDFWEKQYCKTQDELENWRNAYFNLLGNRNKILLDLNTTQEEIYEYKKEIYEYKIALKKEMQHSQNMSQEANHWKALYENTTKGRGFKNRFRKIFQKHSSLPKPKRGVELKKISHFSTFPESQKIEPVGQEAWDIQIPQSSNNDEKKLYETGKKAIQEELGLNSSSESKRSSIEKTGSEARRKWREKGANYI